MRSVRSLFTLTLALIFACQGLQADQKHHSSESSSSSTQSESNCPPASNRSLFITSTLESLELIRGEFTAEYFIELTNTGSSAIKDVIIQDTVSVTDNVIESLTAEVSYEAGTIFPSGQVLTLPTIDRIEANSTFSFTLTLHMTLDPGVTANVVQHNYP